LQCLSEFRDVLQTNLAARWSSPKWLACIIVEESARTLPTGIQVGVMLRSMLTNLVDHPLGTENISLDLVPFLQTLRRKCQALENAFIEHGQLPSNKLPVLPALVQGEPEAGPQAFSLSSAVDLTEKEFDKLTKQLSALHRAKASKLLRESRESLLESIQDFRARKEVQERRIVSAAASTILWLGDLGSKLNPIIQGIMSSVKVCYHPMFF
jgi:TATA-binding protein-associated factor